jgi:hypothetical protein
VVPLRIKRREQEAAGVANDTLIETSTALITTRPTTVGGIGALCRYMTSLLEKDTPGLWIGEEVDDPIEVSTATFCDTIAAAIEAMP